MKIFFHIDIIPGSLREKSNVWPVWVSGLFKQFSDSSPRVECLPIRENRIILESLPKDQDHVVIWHNSGKPILRLHFLLT